MAGGRGDAAVSPRSLWDFMGWFPPPLLLDAEVAASPASGLSVPFLFYCAWFEGRRGSRGKASASPLQLVPRVGATDGSRLAGLQTARALPR